MPIRTRYALTKDIDELLDLARADAETRPDLTFNETRARATFVDYYQTANPTIWVAENETGLIGFLMASYSVYRSTDGLFTSQEVIYVKPENRGSRAATLLMRELIDWSRKLGAKEIIGGNDNNFDSDRTAKFLGHFGFEKVGYAMRLNLHGQQRR